MVNAKAVHTEGAIPVSRAARIRKIQYQPKMTHQCIIARHLQQLQKFHLLQCSHHRSHMDEVRALGLLEDFHLCAEKASGQPP